MSSCIVQQDCKKSEKCRCKNGSICNCNKNGVNCTCQKSIESFANINQEISVGEIVIIVLLILIIIGILISGYVFYRKVIRQWVSVLFDSFTKPRKGSSSSLWDSLVDLIPE
jgi:hypothetical protein